MILAASPNSVDNFGFSVLMMAINAYSRSGRTQPTDSHGRTPEHVAHDCGFDEIAALLKVARRVT
jgi:hypothetical protein